MITKAPGRKVFFLALALSSTEVLEKFQLTVWKGFHKHFAFVLKAIGFWPRNYYLKFNCKYMVQWQVAIFKTTTAANESLLETFNFKITDLVPHHTCLTYKCKNHSSLEKDLRTTTFTKAIRKLVFSCKTQHVTLNA